MMSKTRLTYENESLKSAKKKGDPIKRLKGAKPVGKTKADEIIKKNS